MRIRIWVLAIAVGGCSSLREVGGADARDGGGDGDGGIGSIHPPPATGTVLVDVADLAVDRGVDACEGQVGPASIAWTGDELVLAWTEVWEDDSGVRSENTLHVSRVDSDGTLLDTATLDGYPSEERDTHQMLAWTGGESVATYSSERDGEREIYSQTVATDLGLGIEQRLTTADSPIDACASAWFGDALAVAFPEAGTLRYVRAEPDVGVLAGSERDLSGPTSGLGWIVSAPAGIGLAFPDSREGQPDIFFALVGADGEPARADGLKVAATADESSSPRVAWTGTEFAVIWVERPEGEETTTVSFARVDASGTPVDGSERSVLPDDAEPGIGELDLSTEQYAPVTLLWTGSDLALVVWRESSRGTIEQDVVVERIDAEGNLIAGSPTVVASAMNMHGSYGTGIGATEATLADNAVAVVWAYRSWDWQDGCVTTEASVRYELMPLD